MRRHMPIRALLVLLTFVLSACGSAQNSSGDPDEAPETAEDSEPLRIAHTVWVGYGPLYLAQEKGFFAEEGVEVELVQQQDFRQQFVALAAGRVDGIANVVDATISYRVPEVEYQIVLALDDSLGGDGIAAKSDIESIEDLRGKRVAYETGATAQFFLNVMLERHGMTEDDIEHIDMLGSDAGAALLSGQVDAAVTYEPYLTELRDGDDTHVLVDTRDAPGLIVDVVLFNREVIDARPDDVQAVVDAYYRALEYMDANPDESVEIMAAGVGGFLEDPEEFRNTLQYVVFYDQERNRAYFDEGNDNSVFGTLESAIDIWSRISDIENVPEPAELVAPQFVKGT